MNTNINYREIQVKAGEHAQASGFLDGEINYFSLISGVNGEVAEFAEAFEKGKVAELQKYKDKVAMLDSYSEYGALKDHWFNDLMKDTQGDELADIAIRLCTLAECLGVIIQREHFKNQDQVLNISLDERNVYMMINRLYELVSHVQTPLVVASEYSGHFHHINISNCLYAVELISEYLGVSLEYHIVEKMRYNLGRPRLHGK